MEIALLGSGSRGNAILVRSNGAAFLVDAGLSGRQIRQRLAAFGLAPSDLLGVVVTHEHIDHIRSAGTLARQWGLPVWTNRPTFREGSESLGTIPEWVEVEVGLPFEIGGVRMEPFSVPHDAADPFGLLLEDGDGYRAAIATDMGFVTRLARERLRGLQGLVLEFNHDPAMLIDGPYPWPVKQRIQGKLGHLSNEEAADLLAEVASDELEWLVCAHISQENNAEDILLASARSGLARANGAAARVRPYAASQDRPTPLFGPRGTREEAS